MVGGGGGGEIGYIAKLSPAKLGLRLSLAKFLDTQNMRKSLNVICVVKFFTVKQNVGFTKNLIQSQPREKSQFVKIVGLSQNVFTQWMYTLENVVLAPFMSVGFVMQHLKELG